MATASGKLRDPRAARTGSSTAVHIAAMKTHCSSHEGPRTDVLLGRLGHEERERERERERAIAMKTHFSSHEGPRIDALLGHLGHEDSES